MKRLNVLLSLTLFLLSVTVSAQESSMFALEDYLHQVTDSNLGIQGSKLNSSGAAERFSEGSLVYSPQLFSNLKYTDDRKPTLVPAIQGDRTITDLFSIGVSKQTDFGMLASLSYNYTRTDIFDIDTQFISTPDLTVTNLSFQFTQALIKNGFGKATRSTQEAIDAQAHSTSYTESYAVKTMLSDAETRYWRLAVARQAVVIAKDSLERATKIRDFNANQEHRRLADTADRLQAEANLKQRQMDLKKALNEERSAMRAFNEARHRDSNSVQEKLALLSPEKLKGLSIPERAEKRDDVRAAEQTMKASVANSETARQNQLPQLDLIGGYATNGQDPNFSASTAASFSTHTPTVYVGVNFSVPLDRNLVSSVRSGYLKGQMGSERTYQEKLFAQENDWKDLVQRFTEAKDSLALAVDLVQAQKAKLDQERIRQKRGQSSTYQVFLFEQDYLDAEQNLIQTQGDILNIRAQMKTFEGGT